MTTRIDSVLATALTGAGEGAPPRLVNAIRYAVFPGGARIRPRLSLAVARACGEPDPAVADAAAAAIEILHCASLAHDDLPCFDDAPLRRGKPSLHKAFDERLAVLAGDALIVLAFETVARVVASAPERVASLALIIGRGVGMPNGIVAGQAWESEPSLDLAEYQRAKTGSLFAAATEAGAAAAGGEAASWRSLGGLLGEAYQAADDIGDASSNAEDLGKPVGRDVALNRPSCVRSLGMDGAVRHLKQLVAAAVDSIPDCVGGEELRALILMESQHLVHRNVARRAA